MGNIVVDVTSKKGVTSFAILQNGVAVTKAWNNKYSSQYENLIHGYIEAMPILKKQIENDQENEGEVLIVSNNSTLISWLMRKYSVAKYVDLFARLMELLDLIPAKINYIQSNNIISEKFMGVSKNTIQEFSTIDSFM